jgi:hypothetical protein
MAGVTLARAAPDVRLASFRCTMKNVRAQKRARPNSDADPPSAWMRSSSAASIRGRPSCLPCAAAREAVRAQYAAGTITYPAFVTLMQRIETWVQTQIDNARDALRGTGFVNS